MPVSILSTAPETSSYLTVASYESSTPESFDTPVLYFKESCSVEILGSHVSRLPPFSLSREPAQRELFKDIDFWVTTRKLIFFDSKTSTGSELPYTSLTLHATQKVGDLNTLYVMFTLSPDLANVTNSDEFDDDENIELTIIPSSGAEKEIQAQSVEQAFKALSHCASIQTEPVGLGSDEDIEQATSIDDSDLSSFLAQGGWVTSENVDQFSAEEAGTGNVIETIPGQYVGNVRARSPVELELGNEDTKWRRTN